MDVPTFERMVQNNEFCEWARVHGNLYGTHVDELERAKRENKKGLLFDVDYQGARQIKAKFAHAISVFILPPSMQELRRRLESRGQDAPESIEIRFAKAAEEIEHYPFFDYIVVNNDLQQALTELRSIVIAQRCRQSRRASAAEALLDRKR
ncbi:MAG: guanylate kinase [Polyangiales bacterium]